MKFSTYLCKIDFNSSGVELCSGAEPLLFDLRPKTSRKELFNREEELRILDEVVSRGDPLILVLGIRRIGKTSLLKSFLEKWHGIYVDMRGVLRESDLYRRISEGLADNIGKMKKLIEGIRGVKVLGVEVEIKWKGKDSISLIGLLEELNRKGERVVVVFDEAQLIQPPVSAEIKSTIAYAYDNLENITIILSGSEIGLLRRFISIEDTKSPLYGRYAYELHVKRFSKDLSLEFLKQGFKELNVNVSSETIEEAVELFDGIVGWLVFYGKSYVDGIRDVNKIFNMAIQLAIDELSKLSRREKLVLKAIAKGAKSWSSIRKYVEEKEGVTIPKSSLTRIIRKLENLSIIENYRFLDPIYREASKRIRN